MTTKYCRHCGTTKDVSEFGKNVTRPDGLQMWCKRCMNAATAVSAAKRKQGTRPDAPLPLMDKGTLADDALDGRKLKELAMATRNWARQIKAEVHPVTGAHGYFTRDEWVAEFGQSERIWGKVKNRMYELGYPLSKDSSIVASRNGSDDCGYYLGTNETWGQSVASDLQGAVTRLATLSENMRAIHASGKAGEVIPIIKGRLANGRHEIAIDTIPLLLKSAGFDGDGVLERLFLAETSQTA